MRIRQAEGRTAEARGVLRREGTEGPEKMGGNTKAQIGEDGEGSSLEVRVGSTGH